MTKTKVETESSSPANQPNQESTKNKAASLFALAVLDLSWQLAVVVLIPIIGGYEIDKQIGSTPALTILGFIIAMFGTYFVIKKMLTSYSQKTVGSAKRS